jgi:hypothetical protein
VDLTAVLDLLGAGVAGRRREKMRMADATADGESCGTRLARPFNINDDSWAR